MSIILTILLFFLLIILHRKEKALSRACHFFRSGACTLDRAFCLLSNLTKKYNKYHEEPAKDNTAYPASYILHTTCKQEHEPKELAVYHGTLQYQYHAEPVCPCVSRKRQGRIKEHDSLNRTTIFTTFDHEDM